MKPRLYIKDYSTRVLVNRSKIRISDILKAKDVKISNLEVELKKDKEFPFRLGFRRENWDLRNTITLRMEFNTKLMLNENNAINNMMISINESLALHIKNALNGEMCPR